MNEYFYAARVLDEMLSSGRHLDDCFNSDSTPLVQQICYGVTRHYYYLDGLLDQLLKKPLPDKHSDLHCLLMAGLYSMDHLKRPAHASVNAVVETAPALKKGWAKGLINGVLRRYGRESDKLRTQVSNDNIEVQFNHPTWLIDEIKNAWPQYEAILEANQAHAPMTLRVNERRITVKDYLEKLEAAGLEGRRGLLSDSAVTLATPVRVSYVPGFAEGEVSVQDEAAQLAANFLNLEVGQHILDACAAPGSKTCHLLEKADVTLTAIDRDRKRIGHIEENLERLGLFADVISTELEAYSNENGFDRVLLDVPCSASGIVRRHPDIKLLRQKSDVDKLEAIQRTLLNKAFDLLRTGGELLYSTCSIFPRENEDIIADFINNRSDAACRPLSLDITSSAIVKTPHGIQLLPTNDQHDGFFYASIKKIGAETLS